ncbi:methyltransferase domain-containing protein [Clostridium lacusfryxellense]|nr:methyltransferase domain-containing protein [Clostridium lacusfryxellense]
MKELSLFDKIKMFCLLDVLDMGIFEDSCFDCIVCIGGVINYLLDKEKDGINEMLRVLKPGGTLIVDAMSRRTNKVIRLFLFLILHKKTPFTQSERQIQQFIRLQLFLFNNNIFSFNLFSIHFKNHIFEFLRCFLFFT